MAPALEPLAEELDPPARASTRQPAWLGVLLTLATWLVARLAVGALTPSLRWPWRGLHPAAHLQASFLQWDGFTYLDISRQGRWLEACNPQNIQKMIFVWPGQRWCGNAQWLPGYPELVHLGHRLGLPSYTAATLISWSALALAIGVVWAGWCRDLHPLRALATMLAFALFVGMTWAFAPFPIAVAVLGVAAAAALATSGRWVLGALAVGLAGYAYPSAWFAGLAFGALAVAAAWPSGRRARLRALVPAALSSIGLLMVVVGDQLRLGRYDAFWLLQTQQHGERFTLPGLEWLRVLAMRSPLQQRSDTDLSMLLAAEAFVALALVALALLLALREARRSGWSVGPLVPSVLGAAVCLGLLVGTNPGTWDRSVALASVSVVGLRRLPAWALALVVAVLGVLAVAIAPSYLSGKLP